MIKLDKLDHAQALRYLGYGSASPKADVLQMLTAAEKELLKVIKPKGLYQLFSLTRTQGGIQLGSTSLTLTGERIQAHLQNCEWAVLLCATISSQADILIRKAQVTDMVKALVLDSLASVAVEQTCDILEEQIKQEHSEYYTTWRFSPGYGDLPIDTQPMWLNLLDAPRKIGLHSNESCMLIPTKSVTALIGLSKEPLKKGRRGCAGCSMKNSCKFRKEGNRCV